MVHLGLLCNESLALAGSPTQGQFSAEATLEKAARTGTMSYNDVHSLLPFQKQHAPIVTRHTLQTMPQQQRQSEERTDSPAISLLDTGASARGRRTSEGDGIELDLGNGWPCPTSDNPDDWIKEVSVNTVRRKVGPGQYADFSIKHFMVNSEMPHPAS